MKALFFTFILSSVVLSSVSALPSIREFTDNLRNLVTDPKIQNEKSEIDSISTPKDEKSSSTLCDKQQEDISNPNSQIHSGFLNILGRQGLPEIPKISNILNTLPIRNIPSPQGLLNIPKTLHDQGSQRLQDALSTQNIPGLGGSLGSLIQNPLNKPQSFRSNVPISGLDAIKALGRLNLAKLEKTYAGLRAEARKNLNNTMLQQMVANFGRFINIVRLAAAILSGGSTNPVIGVGRVLRTGANLFG